MIEKNPQVRCIIGNPPYNVAGPNKGDWIINLLDDYKKEPGGNEKLQEINSVQVNDDYVKFLRYGQHLIEENGVGILAFITPHGFLDNLTFRGVRWNMLKVYEKIYIIDLHGNTRRKEVCPDGSKDVNIFDVMQGVSINIFIRTGKKSKEELAKVFHHEIYGERDFKYDFLKNSSLKTINFKEVKTISNNYFFIPKNFKYKYQYEKGFKITELFNVSGTGIRTGKDSVTINMDKDKLEDIVSDFKTLPVKNLNDKFNVKTLSLRSWNTLKAKEDVINNKGKYYPILYRPFDIRTIYFTGKDGFVTRDASTVTRHLLIDKKTLNIGLLYCRQYSHGDTYQHFFVTDNISCGHFLSFTTRVSPLYIYPDKKNNS